MLLKKMLLIFFDSLRLNHYTNEKSSAFGLVFTQKSLITVDRYRNSLIFFEKNAIDIAIKCYGNDQTCFRGNKFERYDQKQLYFDTHFVVEPVVSAWNQTETSTTSRVRVYKLE